MKETENISFYNKIPDNIMWELFEVMMDYHSPNRRVLNVSSMLNHTQRNVWVTTDRNMVWGLLDPYMWWEMG